MNVEYLEDSGLGYDALPITDGSAPEIDPGPDTEVLDALQPVVN